MAAEVLPPLPPPTLRHTTRHHCICLPSPRIYAPAAVVPGHICHICTTPTAMPSLHSRRLLTAHYLRLAATFNSLLLPSVECSPLTLLLSHKSDSITLLSYHTTVSPLHNLTNRIVLPHDLTFISCILMALVYHYLTTVLSPYLTILLSYYPHPSRAGVPRALGCRARTSAGLELGSG